MMSWYQITHAHLQWFVIPIELKAKENVRTAPMSLYV
jgi:hypothetical protein